MQEKTLEELANETRERIVKECWHKTETGHALDMTGTRELIVEALEKAREEGRKEERQFILNVLDGIDIADKEMGIVGGTKAIRFALKNRII